MFEALRIAYLQIERHAFESVVVTFDLSTQIACYQREREVVVGVVVVEPRSTASAQEVYCS